MALEDLTGTDKFVSSLNSAWPVDDDWVDEGDNHIRGVKNVLKNSFPVTDGAVYLSSMQARFPDGFVTAPGISWIEAPNSGVMRSADGAMVFVMFGVEAARFTPDKAFKASTHGSGYHGNAWVHEVHSQLDNSEVLQVVHGGTVGISGVWVTYPASAPRSTGAAFLTAQDSVGVIFSVVSNSGIHNYAGNNVNLSDERVKTEVREGPDHTAFVEGLRFKRFRYADQPNMGEVDDVTAQDLEALAPELVVPFGEDGMKGVLWYQAQQRINSVVPRLIERIKSLEAKLASITPS